ncbi:hypothetical protein [Tamlana sp. I1]|uniref:hypothetical protein n=1 Tax=Tamlana sp. I1 TaxID=2762061 RepID=UPI00188EC7BC|nr:hypothetical protein [Tamlana sp. I1]
MKKTGIIIFSLFSLTVLGQEIDSTKVDEIEIYEKIMYGMNSGLFKNQKYYSELDENYKLPWVEKKYTNKQLESALDTLAINSKIKIIDDPFSDLVIEFDSYFPSYIKGGLSNIFKLLILNNQIKDQNLKNIQIKKDGSVTFGSKFSSGFKDGKSYSNDWKTITKSFKISSKENKENLKGKIKFKSSFILDYHYVKINKLNKGQSLKIGSLDFKVIDFYENKVILDFKQNTEEINFSFVNIDDYGNRISQIPYFNFEKLKNDDKSIPSDATSIPEGGMAVSKVNYDIFKADPNLSFYDYKKIVRPIFIEILNSKQPKEKAAKVWGNKYRAFSSSDVMLNFILFYPKNHIEKEFELTIE